MNTRLGTLALGLTLIAGACDRPLDPGATVETADPATRDVQGVMASGTFTQTAITSLDVRNAGRNTIIKQTSEGLVAGSLQGTYEDNLHVVIHPNGSFHTTFSIVCACEMGGNVGTLEFIANDKGTMTGPTTAAFSGKAVIRGASGGLERARGVLAIEGTVDLVSGLSEYSYEGTIRD